jgi:hypothetical protein
MTVLFLNGTGDGANPVDNNYISRGGSAVFHASGVFDGASVTIQAKSNDDPNLEWVSLTNGVLSQAGNKYIEFIPHGYEVRAVIATAGVATDLFVEVRT